LLLRYIISRAGNDTFHSACIFFFRRPPPGQAMGNRMILLLSFASDDVFFDLPIDMIAKFLVQFLLDLAAAKKRAQP
jgi:hypothetical protein